VDHTIEVLEEILTAFKAADEERLNETHERTQEAEKWKSEGDWYGWNFYTGMSSGTTAASIIFHRVQRLLEKHLVQLRKELLP
jgi:hypothetical protein